MSKELRVPKPFFNTPPPHWNHIKAYEKPWTFILSGPQLYEGQTQEHLLLKTDNMPVPGGTEY